MSLDIQLNNGQSEIESDFDFLLTLAAEALKELGAPEVGELSIALLSKEDMRGLNRRLRGEDYYPDVLSYTLAFEPFLGEVFISPLIAREQGEDFNNSAEQELALLLVHGILHLFGYDDNEPEKKSLMEEKQEQVLSVWKKRTSEG